MSDLTGCFTSLYPIGDNWVGTTVGGRPVHFQSMDAYRTYIGQRGCPDVSALRNMGAAARAEEKTPPTGFKEFKPKYPEQQTLYSAMSPYWIGRASDSAKVYH